MKESISRRPGKEKARTPSPSRHRGEKSKRVFENFVQHDQRSRMRTRLHSTVDSDEDVRRRFSRQTGRVHRHERDGNVSSGSSQSWKSQSPPVRATFFPN